MAVHPRISGQKVDLKLIKFSVGICYIESIIPIKSGHKNYKLLINLINSYRSNAANKEKNSPRITLINTD